MPNALQRIGDIIGEVIGRNWANNSDSHYATLQAGSV
jgi:hypothetical protein